MNSLSTVLITDNPQPTAIGSRLISAILLHTLLTYDLVAQSAVLNTLKFNNTNKVQHNIMDCVKQQITNKKFLLRSKPKLFRN